MTFSAPMSNFRTFQVLKNEKSNFRTSGNPGNEPAFLSSAYYQYVKSTLYIGLEVAVICLSDYP